MIFSNIMEEIPLTIRVNPLLSSFISSLSENNSGISPMPPPLAFQPNFNAYFDTSRNTLTQNLERLVDSLDEYKSEEVNIAYLSRQIARERVRAEAQLQKRREENAARVAQGLAPLSEDDINRLFKIPSEPSRLDSVLLLGQVDSIAKNLATSAGVGLAKLYATNSLSTDR